MDEHPNVALMRKGYEAFAGGDFTTVGELFADDIVWHSPGTNPLSGEFKGKDQVFGLFARLAELTNGTFQQEIHDIVANDDHVCVMIHNSWSKPKSFEGRAVQVWHMRDGKATEFWLFPEDLAASDAAFMA